MPQLLPLSARIIDAIIRWEVSSREHYERNLMRPCWPAEMSGVTIGIGYDLGYQTRDGFMRENVELKRQVAMQRKQLGRMAA